MSSTLKYLRIDDAGQLQDFCERCGHGDVIGFDTEFVSENRYRPELCLLQVASENEIAIVDTLRVPDLNPFWSLLIADDQATLAHAAREEFLFCFRACGKKPARLFDVQLAAAFVGFDYPASYANLVTQILGARVPKGETRTDWKRRPLSDKQIRYAIGDVEHLHALYEELSVRLQKSGRLEWYYEEIAKWMNDLARNEQAPQWHRISGVSRLNRRSLGILQQLWLLREGEAEKRNRSPKRVIPDDLMIELAKRSSSRPSSFKAIRGFENRVHRGLLPPIADAIQRGIDLPDKQLPKKPDRGLSLNLGLLGQYLSTVLNVVCRQQDIAPALVGTAQDLRHFAAWRLGMIPASETPVLSTGWRAEIVGSTIDKALQGEIGLRVDNPRSDEPLTIQDLG